MDENKKGLQCLVVILFCYSMYVHNLEKLQKESIFNEIYCPGLFNLLYLLYLLWQYLLTAAI